MHSPDNQWFTEKAPSIGTGFSLGISAKLHEEQTPFQKLEIYQTTHFGKLMVLDGCIMLSERDNFIYHEMMAHPALFSHAAPGQVVIIGGGDCGTLREVLKHDCVERAWQIDIDERVTRNAERFFPQLCDSNHDPRANLLFIDGIRWMQEAEPGSIDVIIVDSTDPIGPAEGLFGEAFYASCHRALANNGILVQQSESPLAHAEHITWPMQAAMRAAGFAGAQTLFYPMPMYPTGWWSSSLAVKGGVLQFTRRQAAAGKSFPTDYYNAAIHEAALAQPEFFHRRQMPKPIGG